MSKEQLRDDIECANCGYTVDVAYCSKCGQKNTETRQPFHHLFTHFIEDLTHYDGAFWKTIKHLLFRPAKLTREYLEGKRQTYVPPVKLYIFISFITFFLLNILPGELKGSETNSNIELNNANQEIVLDRITVGKYQFDSLESFEKFMTSDAANQMSTVEYWIGKAILNIKANKISYRDLMESYFKLMPKILFIYLPVFCFWLWLFHGKKRWYFFDHGIFTLHYFSVLLLLFTITQITAYLAGFTGNKIVEDTVVLINLLVLFGYSMFYFFRAHRLMYCETRWISRLKSVVLFFINFTFISMLLVLAVIYLLFTIH